MRSPILISTAAVAAAIIACGAERSLSPAPTLSVIDVALDASAIEVGQVIKVAATPLDQHGDAIDAGEPVFASSNPTVAEVDPKTGVILGISSGSAAIIATVGAGSGARSGSRTINVAFPAMIVVNEIKSNDDGPGGWVELYNPTTRPVDLEGWKVANEHINQAATLPAGTSIAPKGYLVLDESLFPLGISRVGGVHLFSRYSVIVDDPFWSLPIQSTIGRCPDGTPDLVALATPTKGTSNACPATKAR
jgi:hypothetical protein